MKKILLSLAIIGVAAAVVVGATSAYFSDTETSSGNTFTAGTIDLTLGGTGATGVSFTNMAPGDIESADITVTNDGSLAGWLGARSSYVEESPVGVAPNMTEDEMAKMLIITVFTADGNDMLGAIPDVDSDGKKTVYDMVNDPSIATNPPPHDSGQWYSYDSDMTAGENHIYVMTVQFDPSAGNDYQGDGIVWTFEFLLDQQ